MIMHCKLHLERCRAVNPCRIGPASFGPYPHAASTCRRSGIRRQTTSAQGSPQREACDVVRDFYTAYNSGDVDAVMALMSEDVAYHDLALYQEPFRGRAAVRAYFEKVTSIVPSDLKFVPEVLTSGDKNAAGVRWHVEIQGNEFPFSRGCSFYEVNDEGLITSARDLVESATKPGGTALWALKGLAPVVRKLGPRANPGNLPSVPPLGILMWAFYAVYLWHILLSPAAPGAAAWQQTPEALQEVLNESINFFYINIGLSNIGLNPLPSIASHPVSEALFNFVNAWSLMLGPLMFADRKAANVPNKLPIWVGTMFLTNIFFISYLCFRESDPAPVEEDRSGEGLSRLPAVRTSAGWIAAAVGATSIGWALFARPEYGGIAERLQFAYSSLTGDRIFYAFVVDAALYSVWQAALMPPAAGRLRFVPFFGLARWLVRKT